jgi:1,4-alpha-glucan branching enzyme
VALPWGTDRAQVWDEVLNTDAEQYGGSGVGNLGQVYAIPEGQDGWPARAWLRVPPLGALWLAPRPLGESEAVAVSVAAGDEEPAVTASAVEPMAVEAESAADVVKPAAVEPAVVEAEPAADAAATPRTPFS